MVESAILLSPKEAALVRLCVGAANIAGEDNQLLAADVLRKCRGQKTWAELVESLPNIETTPETAEMAGTTYLEGETDR